MNIQDLALAAVLIAGCGTGSGDPDGGQDGGPDPISTAECLADPACSIPIVSAHRGLCGSEPENTIAAFLECQRAGVPMVEVDTRETADGFVVIMHDSDVDRTTDGEDRFPGRTAVDQLSLEEFLSLVIDDPDCTGSPGDDPQRCHPSTLRAMLDATDEALLLDLDFKAGDPARAAQVFLEAGAPQRVMFFDSDLAALRSFRAVIPDGVVMPRGSTLGDFQDMLGAENEDLDLRWAHGDSTGIQEVAALLQAHDVRLYINAWAGDSPSDIWVGAAELLSDPDQRQQYLDRAWDALDEMLAAGALGFGTDFAHVYAGHLYPDGFGR